MNNINDKYRDIVFFLNKISLKFCTEKNIKLSIEIPNEDKLNAGVKKIGDNRYCIKIYPGCLNLYYSIEKITKRYNEDDLQHFSKFKRIAIFECHEEDTYREELNNLFSTVILLQIFWHEMGHIDAGYVDRTREYVEFDSSEVGCYSKQEQEMVADWFSTKQVFKYIYNSVIHGRVRDADELIKVLQQLVELYWITLTIEFQIFDSKLTGEVTDFSSLSHPYPSVRLLYSIEAMLEAIVDIFNTFGLDDADSENGIVILVKDIYIIIQSFLQITDCPIDVEKYKKEAMDCYKTLRELPYSKGYEKNNFRHLLPLNDSILEDINNLLHS